ncbi:acyltransferase [Fructilactobacillus carniphilus]|uniref:Acyltransferase n=1 Tax=Fructilactobacillus carniphilus TaxID=2940297 RepID=A0ABY5BW88_9LACO|nr:acyltransferase [Fructilactobacillus carniphilus]USS90332.1 acyltransferase [Fructilactobacillus carniphilus]
MKKRIIYIDLINIVAIFSVLMLHSSQYISKNGMVQKNGIIQDIFIPAVYLFFINSGATLLNYRTKYSTKTFLIKRIKRVGIPLIVWSIIYYLYDIKFTAFPGPIPHPNPGIKDFIYSFLNNNINNIFWFFYAIILLYLLTPVLAVLAEKNKTLLLYLVGLNFIANYVYLDFVHALNLPIVGGTSGLQLNPIASEFVGFFIMGYLLKINYFSNKAQKIMIGVGMIALVISLLTTAFKINNGPIGGILLFWYAIALYLIIKKTSEKTDFFNKHEKWFAGAASVSLGIYILHPIFFKVFEDFFKPQPNSFIFVWIMPIVTYLIVGLIIFVIRKTPIIKDILP